MSDRPHLSVVVPVHDEAPNLRPLYAAVRRACDPLGRPWELIFVDDGSRDGTAEEARLLHREDPRVRLIRLRANFGQTVALREGLARARGTAIVSLDGDLQNDPADIPRLLAGLDQGFDVVCGWRRARREGFWSRRLPSVVANRLVAALSGLRVHDSGCSLRAYRAAVVRDLPLYGEWHRFVPPLCALAGARVTEVEVRHHPRRAGRSKYGLGRVWRVVLDLVTLTMLTGFAARPLYWFGLLGAVPALLGLLLLPATLHAYWANLAGTRLVLGIVTFLLLALAAQLLALGLVGELAVAGLSRPGARPGRPAGERPAA